MNNNNNNNINLILWNHLLSITIKSYSDKYDTDLVWSKLYYHFVLKTIGNNLFLNSIQIIIQENISLDTLYSTSLLLEDQLRHCYNENKKEEIHQLSSIKEWIYYYYYNT